MKWSKFTKVLESSPWLQFHIGSPALQSAPLNVSAEEARRQLKEHVRTRLDYIAFRPFGQLDLRAGDTDESVQVPNPKYPRLKFTAGTNVQYVIRFHIEGVDYRFKRVRYVYDHGSIANAMKHLVQWHGESWAKRGNAMKFEAVVKVTSFLNEVSQFGKQSIEVYMFPEGFDVTKLEVEAA